MYRCKIHFPTKFFFFLIKNKRVLFLSDAVAKIQKWFLPKKKKFLMVFGSFQPVHQGKRSSAFLNTEIKTHKESLIYIDKTRKF